MKKETGHSDRGVCKCKNIMILDIKKSIIEVTYWRVESFMSFKPNGYQQITFDDSFLNLTARERKALENSWVHIFSEEIFPAIDETRIFVLYGDDASRPNTPVNVIISALIIKKLFDYSDDEIVENLMLDFHLLYDLHITCFKEQPFSDKSLSRFCGRCYAYETVQGIDFYHDCVKDLGSKIAKLMNLNRKYLLF